MKKIVTILMLVCIAVSAFAEPISEEKAFYLENKGVCDAAEYLKVLYNKASLSNPAPKTSTDYTVVDIVTVGGQSYNVRWTADTDLLQFIDNGNHTITVKLPEECPETVYNLIATVKYRETEIEVQIPHTLPEKKVLSNPSYEELVALAYALEDGQYMADSCRLYGTVVAIPTAYSETYGNITVNIRIGQLTDQIVQCYRLTGEGAATLAIGDKITVEGKIKNYKGTIEFDKGCTIVGFGEYPDQSKLVEAAYALESGDKMKDASIMIGEIVKIPSAWSDKYGNITVDIAPCGAEDQIIEAYRLTGEGASALEIGQRIAVYGTLTRYKDTREFASGCVLIPVESYGDIVTLMAAYNLEDGKALDCQRTVTGVVSSIDSAWSDKYGNITVTLVAAGLEQYKIQCYRLTGEGAAEIAVGDTLTVTGTIKNYKGTIEFDKGCTIVK